MTAVQLEIELAKVIRKSLEGLRFQKPSPEGGPVINYDLIKIYEGFAPLEKRGEERIPFLVLRSSSGDYTEKESLVNIHLEIFVYRDDDVEKGYIAHRNGLTILERIRQKLKKNLYSNFYELKALKWKLLDLDNSLSGVEVTLSFTIPQIQEERTHDIIA